MTRIAIVGDGPGGLSAGLFLAKNGAEVHVFGDDETPMHKAMLNNYLGIPEVEGRAFQRIAREQVEGFGAHLHHTKVAQVRPAHGAQAAEQPEGFEVETDAGETFEVDYVILAMAQRPLLTSLGLNPSPQVDRSGRSEKVSRVYVVGWPVRQKKIQAIIVAGDGAAAALDILSREAGEDVHDFDVIDDA